MAFDKSIITTLAKIMYQWQTDIKNMWGNKYTLTLIFREIFQSVNRQIYSPQEHLGSIEIDYVD